MMATANLDVEMQLVADMLKKNSFSTSTNVEKIFNLFDKDCDGFLDRNEFKLLLKNVITQNGKPGTIPPSDEEQIFSFLDDDNDGKLSRKEFLITGKYWLKQIFNSVTALLVIDVQNDFIDGSLSLKNCPAMQNSEEVVPVINRILENTKFDIVVYTFDWHPQNHISFLENVKSRTLDQSSQVSADSAKPFDTLVFAGSPKKEQTLYPTHCVQNSWGSELHKDLKVVDGAVFTYKGTNPEVDSYSAFWDNSKLGQTTLASELAKRKITDVYCCGLAADICVGATATHAVEHGFRTIVIEDAVRGVDEINIQSTKTRLEREGAVYVNSNEVNDLVTGNDRRSRLALRAAINVSEGIKMARAMMKNGGKKS